MTRHRIIVNPTAGRGASGQAIPEIERHLNRHRLEFDLVRTERPWHAAELAQESAANGYHVVVAVGGDGTANEVLNGLMQAKEAGAGTAALELIEETGPLDYLLAPVGGGGLLSGTAVAAISLSKGKTTVWGVEPAGADDAFRSFESGRLIPQKSPRTIADGLRVPAAVGDFLILRTLRESDGTAIAVADEELIEAANLIGRTQGMFVCPESAATLVAFRLLRSQGWIGDDETVVLFSTGNGLKYAHLWAS